MERELEEVICSRAAKDPGFAIAWALLELGQRQKEIAREINTLGFKDAATPFGAMELLGLEFRRIADALDGVARAIRAASSQDDED